MEAAPFIAYTYLFLQIYVWLYCLEILLKIYEIG